MIRTQNIVWLLLVALGLNLAVAWLAVAMPHPLDFDAAHTAALRRRLWDRADTAGEAFIENMRLSGAYSAAGKSLIVIRPDLDLPQTVHRHRAGWPLAFVEGDIEYTLILAPQISGKWGYSRTARFIMPLNLDAHTRAPRNVTGATGTASMAMLPLGLDPVPIRALPCRPVWPGLLVNTVLYALTIVLLRKMCRGVRGVHRRFRGRCFSCGYDLGGLDHETCPECGRSIRR